MDFLFWKRASASESDVGIKKRKTYIREKVIEKFVRRTDHSNCQVEAIHLERLKRWRAFGIARANQSRIVTKKLSERERSGLSIRNIPSGVAF
jgi:hypothetical protein